MPNAQPPASMDGPGGVEGKDWLDMPLPEALAFPGVRFGKGVPLRLVIDAATRWKKEADKAWLLERGIDTPEKLADLRASITSLTNRPEGGGDGR